MESTLEGQAIFTWFTMVQITAFFHKREPDIQFCAYQKYRVDEMIDVHD